MNHLKLQLWRRNLLLLLLVNWLVKVILVLQWHLVGVLLSIIHTHWLLHAILLVSVSLLALVLILIHVVVLVVTAKLAHSLWHLLVLLPEILMVMVILVLILMMVLASEATLMLLLGRREVWLIERPASTSLLAFLTTRPITVIFVVSA